MIKAKAVGNAVCLGEEGNGDMAVWDEPSRGRAKWVADQNRRKELVIQYKPLVMHIWKSLPKNAGVDEGDVILAGYEAMVKKSQSYRFDSEAKFNTYAWWAIKGAMLREINKGGIIRVPTVPGGKKKNPELIERVAKARSPVSLSGLMADGEDMDIIDSASVESELPDGWEKVAAAMAMMPPRLRKLICLHVQHEWTIKDLAKRFGLSQKAITEKVQRGLDALHRRVTRKIVLPARNGLRAVESKR